MGACRRLAPSSMHTPLPPCLPVPPQEVTWFDARGASQRGLALALEAADRGRGAEEGAGRDVTGGGATHQQYQQQQLHQHQQQQHQQQQQQQQQQPGVLQGPPSACTQGDAAPAIACGSTPGAAHTTRRQEVATSAHDVWRHRPLKKSTSCAAVRTKWPAAGAAATGWLSCCWGVMAGLAHTGPGTHASHLVGVPL